MQLRQGLTGDVDRQGLVEPEIRPGPETQQETGRNNGDAEGDRPPPGVSGGKGKPVNISPIVPRVNGLDLSGANLSRRKLNTSFRDATERGVGE